MERTSAGCSTYGQLGSTDFVVYVRKDLADSIAGVLDGIGAALYPERFSSDG